MADTTKAPGRPSEMFAATAADDRLGPTAAERLRLMEPDDWHADLDALASGLLERHRDPFHTISPEQFDATVARLHDRIPDLSGTAILVGFDEIAAMIGDGHTCVETDDHYRRFPLELFWYGDQLRVVKALTDNPPVLGARLVAIGGIAVEEIDRRLQPLIPQGENAWHERARSADRLTRADVLAALNCLPDTAAGKFSFVGQDNASFTAEVASLPPGTAPSWPPPSPDAPLRMRNPDEPLAYTALPTTDVTYANFRRYDGLEQAAGQLIAHLRDAAPSRLILDLRDNSGGDYTLARHNLIYPIWRLPTINRPGGLYVLIGRNTYSAAMVTATDFRRETEAILVGEPTGARPVGYQELGTFDLPRSGLRAHCATRHYRFSDTDTDAVFPDQRIDPDWNTDRSEHDTAIDWCLAHPK
jgi:hypothetical protein